MIQQTEEKVNKISTGYDFHGVIDKGMKPEKDSVIISGAKNTKGFNIKDIPVYILGKEGTVEEKALFKSKVINKLGIETYYESDVDQAKIIRENTQAKVLLPKKMVLIVTDEWLSPSLALTIKNEGYIVLLAEKRASKILKGTIQRIPYADRLNYALQADLIIYEDKSNRDESKNLRAKGYSVIGGDKLTDKLELNRTWANNIARSCGILAPEMIEIDSFEQVREIITTRGGKWVLKQQGKIDEIKGLNFVAKMDNSEDLLDFLPILERNWIEGVKKDFVLQEKIEGHEFAIGSFWNGHEFMKDSDGDELCEENWEHKPLFPGGLGESTGEQYTVQHMIKAKHSKLFMETLDKCRDLLKKIDYRGDFDINSIVNEKGAWFLEFTPRMGVPATSGMLEIHQSSWFDFLKAIADGEQDKNFKYNPDYVIVSWLYTKPFPFVNSHKMMNLYDSQDKPKDMQEIADIMSFRMSNSEGILVNFKKDFTKEDWKHIHPDGLRFRNNRLEIANSDGYVLTASSSDKVVEVAGDKLNELLKKIIVPKGFWRNDFDKSNYHKSKEDLTKWKYLFEDEIEQEKYINSIKKKVKDENKRVEVRELLKKIVL